MDQGWKDDGMGLGEYPNYTEWSYQSRDPNLTYWDQQERRHFGEPLHVNHDALNVWMPDDISNHKYKPREMVLHLGIALGLLGGLVCYSEYIYDAPSRDPAASKPYPFNNLYLEMGGDPDKEPTEKDLKKKIPRPHYGWWKCWKVLPIFDFNFSFCKLYPPVFLWMNKINVYKNKPFTKM